MIRQLSLSTGFKQFSLLSMCVIALSSCDSNNDDDGSLDDELLEDEATTVVVAVPTVSAFGVDVLLLDEDGAALSDASVLVIDDELNGDIVPDGAELLVVENATIRIPLNTFENSAVIRLEAEKDGYFSNGGRYELTAGENLSVRIVLTSEESEQEGISVLGTEGDISLDDINVEVTAADDAQDAVTSVTIPQGIEILDVEGNPLNDSLTVSVVHFDSRNESALAAFPGGFDVVIENVDQIDTPAIEGTVPTESTDDVSPNVTFQSMGFTAIEIFDSEGNKADTFAGEIEVVMAIPPGTLNPQTRQPVQVGDIVPVWSFDTDTARWEYEGREPVEANGRGGLQVTYQADHLSFWNLDYWTGSNCDVDLDITVLSADGQPVTDTPVDVTILGTDANVGYRRSNTLSSGSITLLAVPGTFPVTVNIVPTAPGVSIESITRNGAAYSPGQSFPLCGADGNGIPSNFSVQTDQVLEDILEASLIDYSVDVQGLCSNGATAGTIIPLEGASLVYRSFDFGTEISALTDSNGNARLQGQGDPEGTISVSYWDIVSGGSSSTIPAIGGNGGETVEFDIQCILTTGGTGQ